MVPAMPTVPLLLRVARDEVLAARAAAGDDDAFATLVRRHQARLEAYCASILRNEEDARDAVQNVFLKALTALRREPRRLAVRPWLFRIAHNEAISLLRRRRPAGALAETIEDPRREPPDAVLLSVEVSAILDAVRELPDRPRDALLLHELAGLPHAEVASVLGTSPGGARQAVFEARTALQADRASRNASCGAIRELVAAADIRRRPPRAVRGHLRGCSACRGWWNAEAERRRRLALGAAGLPFAGSVWSWLTGLVGASGGGGAAAKVAASVAAVAVSAPVAVGTIDQRATEPRRARTAAAGASTSASNAGDAAAPRARATGAGATGASQTTAPAGTELASASPPSGTGRGAATSTRRRTGVRGAPAGGAGDRSRGAARADGGTGRTAQDGDVRVAGNRPGRAGAEPATTEPDATAPTTAAERPSAQLPAASDHAPSEDAPDSTPDAPPVSAASDPEETASRDALYDGSTVRPWPAADGPATTMPG
jgi:RNA polymerase sigma factor (sigma-70 family)